MNEVIENVYPHLKNAAYTYKYNSPTDIIITYTDINKESKTIFTTRKRLQTQYDINQIMNSTS